MSALTYNETERRERAVVRLKKRAEFRRHVLVYVFVNVLHVAIWATTGAGFFWPIFPAFGWGIGLAFNAWAVYRRDDGRRVPTDEQIRREMDALGEPRWS